MLANLPKNEKTDYEIEIAPGGMIWQTVFTDSHYAEDYWNWTNAKRFDFQMVEASEFHRITGIKPLPKIEVTKIKAGDPRALPGHEDADSELHGEEFISVVEGFDRNPPKEAVNDYQAMGIRMTEPAKKTKSKLRIWFSKKFKNLARACGLTRQKGT